MIVYVDLEHDDLQHANPGLWHFYQASALKIKYRLEALTGLPCLIVRYPRCTPALLSRLPVQAVLVSGHHTLISAYRAADLAGLRQVFRSAEWPLLGFCGAMQLMAHTYGAEIGPLATNPAEAEQVYPHTPLPPGLLNPDIDPAMQDAHQEVGFLSVRVRQPSPLFDGLSDTPTFFQLHSWEVKATPPGFAALADSTVCAIQVLAHRQSLRVGTQFHPELYDDTYPDGRQFLLNFFRLAGMNGSEK